MSLTVDDYFNFPVPPTVGNNLVPIFTGVDLGDAYTIPLPAGYRKDEAELEINFPGPSSNGIFKPEQLHFHAPSEHTKNDKTLDLEMHIVHL